MATKVATTDQLRPGDIRQSVAGGKTLALFNVDGTIYAIDDTCPHRDCPLSDGELEGTTLTCGCHGSEFDLRTGAVLRGPAERAVRTYPVTISGSDVNVEL